jgi:hypothetical protein
MVVAVGWNWLWWVVGWVEPVTESRPACWTLTW